MGKLNIENVSLTTIRENAKGKKGIRVCAISVKRGGRMASMEEFTRKKPAGACLLRLLKYLQGYKTDEGRELLSLCRLE